MKNLLIFVIGAGCGAIATFFLVKDKAEKQAQEDIDNMRAAFEKQYGADSGVSVTPIESEGEAIEPKEPAATAKKVVTDVSSNPNKVRDYSRFSKAKNKILQTDTCEPNYEVSDELKAIRKNRRKGMYEPVIIDEEEYNELLDAKEYDAMEVEYSPVARFGAYFVDSSGNEISMDSIGSEVEDYFKTQASEDEVVYVRNDELQMIFMVTMEAYNSEE